MQPLWNCLLTVSHWRCPKNVKKSLMKTYQYVSSLDSNPKSSRGLKVHIRTQQRISQIDGASDSIEESTFVGTQTKESCPYCRDEIKSLQKHHVNGFCPKNIEAQRLVLYQQYGQHNMSQGFPAWMIHR